MSDTLASDNEIAESKVSNLDSLCLEDPAPPVDIPLSAECLTAEVQRLGKVVGLLYTRTTKGCHGSDSSQVLDKLNLLLEGQKQLVERKREGAATARLTVHNVSVQTGPEARVDRKVETKGEESDQRLSTPSSGALTTESIAELLREHEGFRQKASEPFL